MASQKTLEHYLRQLRLIEEHREKWCEENVRRHYRDLNKDLQEFLGVQYAELAENDQLTYEILHKKGQYARFIEEVEQRINKFTPKAAQEIKNTVQLTYKKCFEGMVDAVEKSKNYKELRVNLNGIRAVTPDTVKNVVKNSFLEDALEKNHKTNIYNIKQQIGIGLTQGDRMSTMAKRISEQIDSDYKRSIRIARTECHRVREAGFQDSSERISQTLQDNDSDYVMTKTWKTMQDLSVRPYRRKGKKGHASFVIGKGPNHVKMQGVTVLVDDEFDLGDGVKAKTPGQSGVAGHDINCRCYLSRDLMTKAEFEKLTGKKIKSKPVIKPKEDELLETQEQALLNEKNNLEKEKEKYIKKQENLKSYEYEDELGNKYTPADYNTSLIKTKRDEITNKLDTLTNDEIKKLIESNGNNISSFSYELEHRMGLSAKQQYSMRYSQLKKFDGDVDSLEEYVKQQLKLYRSDMNDKLKLWDDFEAQGKSYLKLSKQIKTVDDRIFVIDDEVKTVRAQIMKAKGINVDKIQSEIDEMIAESKKIRQFLTPEQISKFEKTVADKQAELDEIRRRYGITPTIKYAPRTTSARILDDLQTFADNNSSKFNRRFADIARKTGIDQSKVKEEMSKVLGEIIDECDVGMRIKVTNLKKVLQDNDGGFKNLFETGTGGGCTSFSTRGRGEKDVFGYEKAVPTGKDVEDRAIYGMMIPNSRTKDAVDYIANGPGSWYGDGVTCVIKKDKIYKNASFTLGDSLDYSSELCGSTFDNPQFNGAFYDFTDTIKTFLSEDKMPEEKLMHTFSRSDKYMEVQIHGKENHSVDIIDKIIFHDDAAFERAKQKGIIDTLDKKKIHYEVLK